jgi:RHS repeat-associated protein
LSKTSGTADEILNLPSGGGSVSGSGDSFDVDLNTGTATAQFEFTIPAGPNGVLPPFRLAYSAGSGDGPFGIGWSLGLMMIRRKITPSAAAPDPSAVGTYSLVNVGDLVRVGADRYRPTVDATGQLIRFAAGVWTVTDKNDTTCSLGSTAAAQVASGDASGPAAWLIDRCTDSSGNAITYQWLDVGGAKVPQSIAWGTYQLLFRYETRPDAVVDGSFGAPLVLDKRCSSIELHVTTEQPSLVRSWTLLYADEGGRGRSLLATIREQGHAADGSPLAAPDRTYAYSSAGAPAFVPVVGFTAPLNDPDTDLVDLNGDGLPDMLHLGAGLPTMRPNRGGGRFGAPRALSRAPAPLRLSSPHTAFADMSGNGNVDVLVMDRPISGYYPLSAPHGTAPAGFAAPVVFERAPNVLPADPRVRFLDLNGDGITDVLHDTGRAWLVYLREDVGDWSETPRVLPQGRTPPVSLADPHVYLGDMTGDGLTDIVRVDGGGVTYWPARADGGWGAAMTMSPPPALGRDHDPRRLALVDVDGDGCADLIYVGPTSVTWWRNVGAARLAAPVVVANTPPASPGSYRIVDLLGSGTAGIHFQLPETRPGPARQTFLDLCGGTKPYLLTDMAFGAAQSTRVTYRPSTGYARDDADAGRPWTTYHPFPLQCVARIDRTEHGTGITAGTSYTYHDARYDPATRTFLGFGTVDATQLGDATCPSLRVETVFHLGLDPDDPGRPLSGDEALKLGALRRKPLRTTVYGLDGSPLESKPYSVTLHTYDALLVPSGLGDGNRVAVPYVTSSTEQRWERQDAIVSTRVVRYLSVNEEGDVTVQRTQAQRAGGAQPDQDVTSTTTLATGGKNLRLPARVTQTGPDGKVIAVSVTYYDGDPFVGLPEGQATQGLVTRIEELVFDDAFVASIWGATPPDLTAYGYHRLAGDATGWWRTRRAHRRTTVGGGPSLATRGPLGALQTLQYDSSGQRVVAVTDAADNTLTATINARVWQTASVTDANGHTTSDVFDALGRVVATIGPLDAASSPSSTFAYTAGAITQVASTARVVHGGSDVVPAITWLDGFGQMLGRVTPGAAAGQWIVSQAARRNPRGFPIEAYLPYAASTTTWQAPPTGTGRASYAYDALGRLVQMTRTDGLVVRTRRDGTTATTSETWPGGAETDIERQVFDAAGRMIAVSRNAGDHWVEQQYTYAPSGKLSSVTLPGGMTVLFSTDLLGRIFAQQSPDSGHTTYLLDACDNQRRRTNAAGQVVRSDVDVMNRTTAVYHDAETSPRVTYDYYDHGKPAPADGITANRCARLWRVSDELGTTAFQYDEAGRATSSRRTVAATSQTFANATTYDALGRTTSLTLPAPPGAAARTVNYTYGRDGRLAAASGVVKQAQYDIYGRITSIVYQNGASTTIDYRPNAGSIQRVRVSDSGGTLLRDVTVTRTNGLLEGLTCAVAADDDAAFTYDALRRLTGATYSNGATKLDAHLWAYDDTFAMTANSDTGALAYKPGRHQLASVGGQAVTYDPAGRIATARYGTLTFDGADHLTGVALPGGGHLAHTYDYRGQRCRSVLAGAEIYLGPIDNVEVQNGSTVVWIPFGAQRVAADVGGQLWFFHGNALGGADLITDAGGKYADRWRQTPFGASRPKGGPAPAGAPAVLEQLLQGGDPTGLICQGYRWYDPRLGLFISPDPMVPSAFTIGAWNPYLSCLGNPIALFDPSGCSFLDVLEIIGIAVLAAACVVGAIFTGGATLVALGVIASNIGGWLLVGVAVGSLGGALAGEIAAQKAGGNLWAGAFVGALLGGATSLAGGALGGLAATGVDAAFGATHTLLSFAVAGAIQGTLAGAGTGLAIGFAGGKGTVESALIAMAKGAAWGATLGTLLGFGIGSIVGTGLTGAGTPDKFLNIGAFGQKFLDSSSTSATINSIDNWGGVQESLAQLSSPGGFTASNLAGLLPNLITTNEVAAGWLSIPLGWVAPAALEDAGFAAAVDVSMASDQAGFSYAHQLSFLLGAAPYFVDYAVTLFNILDPTDFSKTETAFNNAYGSASPNDTG